MKISRLSTIQTPSLSLLSLQDDPHPQVQWDWEALSYPTDIYSHGNMEEKGEEEEYPPVLRWFLIKTTQHFYPEQTAITARQDTSTSSLTVVALFPKKKQGKKALSSSLS